MSEEALSADPQDDVGELDELGADALFVLTAAMLTPDAVSGRAGRRLSGGVRAAGARSAGRRLRPGVRSGRRRRALDRGHHRRRHGRVRARRLGLRAGVRPRRPARTAWSPRCRAGRCRSRWRRPASPTPHDPDEETGGRPALTPPDTSVWGPPQRRLGADEIAVRWREWRDQFDDAEPDGQGSGARPDSAAQPPTPRRARDRGPAAEPAADSRDGPRAGHRQHAADAKAAPPERRTPKPRTKQPTTADPRNRRTPSPTTECARRCEAPRNTSATPRRPAGCAPRTGRCARTGPAGAWSPGPTTWRSCCSTTHRARCCPVGRGPSLPPLLEALGKLASVAA